MSIDGKYDRAAQIVREAVGGSVVVMVHGGIRGHGMSLCTTDPEFERRLPDLLEQMAAAIRAKNERAKNA